MDKMKEEKKENRILEYIAFSVIATGVILFLITLFPNLTNINGKFDLDSAGKYGSYIQGVIGTLFVLASTFLFYSALREQKRATNLQNEELQLQRGELNLQREELAGTREVLKSQLQTSVDQLHNDVFFRMLNNFDNAVNNFTLIYNDSNNIAGKSYTGLEAVKECAFIYIKELRNYTSKNDKLNAHFIYNDNILKARFKRIKGAKGSSLLQLFRLLSLLYLYIEENIINTKQKILFNKLIKNTTNEYLKFLIALFHIYDPNEKLNGITISLVQIFKIIDNNDFKNYINNENWHKSFMNLLFDAEIIEEEYEKF